MKVKEVMTGDIVYLTPDTSAKEAVELLQKKEISGLPVIDANGKLAGMFTEKDVLAYILPSYIEKVGHFVYQENPKAVKTKFSQLGHVKVSQLMRHDVTIVHEDVTLCEVARMMLIKKVRRIPVVDRAGKIVGIVARCDILNGLAKEARDV